MDCNPTSNHQAKVEGFGLRYRTRLVTLLFTDIVGSTKLKMEVGAQLGATIFRQHHDLVRATLAEFPESEEIETAGDSFFLVFTKPSDAVKFALIFQSRLRRLSKASAVPLQDRIGIHVGEVVFEEDDTVRRHKDLFGVEIDLCSRVMALAKGDQILLTRSAFDNARHVLKGEDIGGLGPLSWHVHGPYRLQGLDEPIEICEVSEGGSRQPPPADSDKARKERREEEEARSGWRPAVGAVIPNTKWVLTHSQGEGRWWETWIAHHPTTKTQRRFKFCFRADQAPLLKRELDLLRVIHQRAGNTPTIPAIEDACLDQPPYYIGTDHLGETDLRAWCASVGGAKRISLETRLEIVAQVANALQAAHDAGVIHGNIEPSHILVHGSGRTSATVQVKLTNFGSSGVAFPDMSDQHPEPQRAPPIGEQMYMSPELIADKTASSRSDIYSLGVVLYQLLLGDLSRPVPPDWSKNITDDLLRADLARCLAGTPHDRFAAAEELASHLRAVEDRRIQPEERKTPALTDWRRCALGAVATVLLGLLFLSPLGDGLKNLSYDLLFLFRPAPDPPIDEVVIIYTDDGSSRELGQPFDIPNWDRALHARLINLLVSQGVTAIAFDVLFDRARTEESDRLLVEAAKAAPGRVVFASNVEEIDYGYKTNLPMPSLRPPIAVFGSAERGDRETRTLRWHTLTDTNELTLAGVLANLTMTNPPPPNSAAKPRWINSYGPPLSIRHYWYYQVIENLVSPQAFSNRVVFVGALPGTMPSSADEWRTPYRYRFWKKGLTLTPGVEITATTYLNLRRGDWLTGLSGSAEVALVVLCGILLAIASTFFRPQFAILLGLIAFLALAVIAHQIVWQQHLWFPWLIVGAVQVPAAVCWSVFSHLARLNREKRALQSELVAAHSKPPDERRQAPGGGDDEEPRTATAAGDVEPGEKTHQTEGVAPPAVPDYTLIRCIGRGAYGEVWLAKSVIRTYNAVKVIHRSRFSSERPYDREFNGIQRFTPISRSHPGFVQILHVGKNEDGGYFYYIMELADDQTTAQRIDASTYSPRTLGTELNRRKRLPVLECIDLGLPLSDALEVMHRHDLIHRDIKPANIIFVNGAAKLADIGLVTDVGVTGRDVTYVGTEGYVPPEGPGKPQADLFSLGKVLYEASTGRDRREFPDLPTTFIDRGGGGDAFFKLNEIILKACEANVANRYRSAAEMRDALQLLRHELTGGSTVVSNH